MSLFQPRLDALPASQRRFWPSLVAVPGHFVLYGGTAVALRLGHRQSADFDFFSAQPFGPEALHNSLAFARNAEVLQKSENTLSLRCAEPDRVLVSFFGGLRLAQVAPPDCCPDTGVWVASLRDSMAAKLNTVFQRAEAKDYLDIDAMLEAGLDLVDGLACARAVYGPGFNPVLPLKALTFFEDGDLPSLSPRVKKRLTDAVRVVSDIPVVLPQAQRIGGTCEKPE